MSSGMFLLLNTVPNFYCSSNIKVQSDYYCPLLFGEKRKNHQHFIPSVCGNEKSYFHYLTCSHL